jgi:hypothetical protein
VSPFAPSWQEIESPIHRPGFGLVMAIGGVFLIVGVIVLACISAQTGVPRWIMGGMAVAFAGAGLGALIAGVRLRRRIMIRHADPAAYPEIAPDPLLIEGTTVMGRVSHAFTDTPQGWELAPSSALERGDRRVYLGFGLPFGILFSGILAWTIHREAAWPLAITIPLGVVVTVVCLGSAIALMAVMSRLAYRRMSSLRVSHDGGLDWQGPTPESGMGRRQLRREQIAAVQCCAWRVVVGRQGGQTSTWAVQLNLVLHGTPPERLQLIASSAYIATARIGRQLSERIGVPFLYQATREHWLEEEARARHRPPLASGGMMT